MASDAAGRRAEISQHPSAASAGFHRRRGNTASLISGISERPQPRDLPPPNPLSASNRRAPSRGCFQRSLAASSEKEAISHKPPPGVNSKHAVEGGATLSPLRSTA